MKLVNPEIWVCSDCMIFLVNGDLSGAYDSCSVERGAAELGPNIVANFDPENNEGEIEFARTPCECCRSPLHGKRHRMAELGPLKPCPAMSDDRACAQNADGDCKHCGA